MASKKTKAHKAAAAAAAASSLLPPPSLAAAFGGSASSLGSQPHMQIHQYVDANKSIDELLQAGRSADSSGKIYERKPKKRLPQGFYQPRMVRQRGSSAGHSPQGSSDDGFSTSRTTLSPSSMSAGAMLMMPFHKKQASAPELDNRDMDMMHTSRPPLAAGAAAGTLPPFSPQHHFSKSVSAIEPAVATDSGGGGVGGSSGTFPPLHMRSVSYDVNQAAAFSHHTHQQVPIGHHHHHHHAAPQQRGYVDASNAPVYDSRGKSQSLDPMMVSSAGVQHQQQQQPVRTQETGEGLPPNWGFGTDPVTGDTYFIDHANQTTTWYDPRKPHHLQDAEIRRRHGVAGDAHAMQQATFGGVAQPQPGAFGDPMQQQQTAQQPQNFSYLEQLQMERNRMLEKQQEIYRDGLLSSPQSFATGSPMMQTNNNIAHDQQYYTQMPAAVPQSSGAASTSGGGGPSPFGHNRTISNDSAVDQGMEVEYAPTPGDPPTAAAYHHIDPTISDVNPHEFDRYLRLSDCQSQQVVSRFQ